MFPISPDKRVSAASDVLKAGMEVKVKVLQIDEAQRRISLSMKAAAQALQEDAGEGRVQAVSCGSRRSFHTSWRFIYTT